MNKILNILIMCLAINITACEKAESPILKSEEAVAFKILDKRAIYQRYSNLKDGSSHHIVVVSKKDQVAQLSLAAVKNGMIIINSNNGISSVPLDDRIWVLSEKGCIGLSPDNSEVLEQINCAEVKNLIEALLRL